MDFQEKLRNARILIVDDQLVNVKLLEKMLQAAGFRHVDTTTDSRETLTLFLKQRHDLILLDIRMPHMDGFEVMKRLKEALPGEFLPVLVLTAQTDRETRIQALEGGARDFLVKPFDRLEMLSRIRNALEVQILHNEIKSQNLLLEERVRQRTQQLWETRLDVIRRLGWASEYRDNETGLHIVRMSRFAEAMARRAGLDGDLCELLLNASPMHDVGKLGIPDHVLLKPGKLDREEWETMKKHTTIGASLLSESDDRLLDAARSIAIGHHERWDGSGYPLGLAGAKIPLFSRITSISDVFDALVSRRPYKDPWPVADAVHEIKTQAGRQFDPDLVLIFLESLDEILDIRARFLDPPHREEGCLA